MGIAVNSMVRKGIENLTWTEEQNEAFETLKKILMKPPILGSPTEDGTYYLDTDASKVAISGILHQEQIINGQKKLVVISYQSRKLS